MNKITIRIKKKFKVLKKNKFPIKRKRKKKENTIPNILF